MNIDPFAPGDSLQHPSHWHDGPPLSVEDTIANTYQWRRDHFAMASEAGQGIPEEVLEERHERHADYLEEFGTPDERREGSEFVSLPALLLREARSQLQDDDAIDEWDELYERYATDVERDPMWVEGVLPSLDELRSRAAAATSQTTPELPGVPKSNALKEEWVEYALAVEKARGGDLTDEQANAMSIADLKAAYKPKAD